MIIVKEHVTCTTQHLQSFLIPTLNPVDELHYVQSTHLPLMHKYLIFICNFTYMFYVNYLCTLRVFRVLRCILKKKEIQKNQNGCVSLSERFIELVYVYTRCDECKPYRTPYVPYYTV